MNRNDMRSVVYLIIALICFYYLMDDFIGKNKISLWVNKFVGDFGGTAIPPAVTDPATEPAAAPAKAKPSTSPATAPAKDTGSIKIPAPEIDTGKIKIPQPQGAPAVKSGSKGFSLNDLVPHVTLSDLFNPFGSDNLPYLAVPAAVAGETLAFPSLIKRAFGG
jgi:hypothetical protein